jgi:hypothetical protein
MKIYLLKVFVLLALFTTASVRAESVNESSPSTKMLMYIQPIEYTNPIYLWHPYDGHWVYQGPLLEGQAMAKFTQVYGDVGLCEGNQSGKTLVWLQPRIFYNPQVQIFYGKVTASVYTGMGAFVASYVGESSLHGYLNLKTDDSVERTYALAIDTVLEKMLADTALQGMMATARSASADATPCSMVTLLPIPKIRVMSF